MWRKRIVGLSAYEKCYPRLGARSNLVHSRNYHENETVYGFRVFQASPFPDYSDEARQNQSKHANLLRLVKAFRMYGHYEAKLDPLNLQTSVSVPELDPSLYLLDVNDTETKYPLVGILHGLGKEATISVILDHLKKTYCGKLAFEFEHVPNHNERRWFCQYIETASGLGLGRTSSDHGLESNANDMKDELIEKQRILSLLSRSEVFDQFMQKKFPQVKRYGLEGGESLVPCLDQLITCMKGYGMKGAVIGMPHRGRLNLLADLFVGETMSPTHIFHKVRGNSELPKGAPGQADVLSHLSCKISLHGVTVNVLPNPSHLEAINPVAVGKTRAKQVYLFDQARNDNCRLGDKYMCIQIHGDAAFCGQGIVMETLGLSNLPHFGCGGSIHVIVNNQIGYTTPALNSRSSVYTSDIAKMINSPVIHVNGDFPEEVVKAAKIAFDYRNKFRRDIIIDLIVYRRWGHNELDEPGFTQPLMYKMIRSRDSVPRLYEKALMKSGIVDETFIQSIRSECAKSLENHFNNSAKYEYPVVAGKLAGKWENCIIPYHSVTRLDTGYDTNELLKIGQLSVSYPNDFNIHARLQKYHVEKRLRDLEGNIGVDWATAEALAFGTLLREKYGVRISGQDVGRGTFSQRHLMLVDQETEKVHVPLNSMGEGQGRLEIANSSLSEFAVLGFEYGCSWENPNTLYIWEAQFGDFFNGAQIIIDTFISGSESKWLKQSGLVMLLPHGYDGAGPEHSSCRFERFLQLCDEQETFDDTIPGPDAIVWEYGTNVNMHVVYPTTPAQYFHLLCRQVKRNFRKPLIVIGPKGLLRLAQAVSPLSEMGPGKSFEPVLSDPLAEGKKDQITRLVFMSGKLYYDLERERTSRQADNVAIVRVEELCPFPFKRIEEEISKYPYLRDIIWCQEEPMNMGAFTYIQGKLGSLLPPGMSLRYCGRKASAIPATGISKLHKIEQKELIDSVFQEQA